MNPSRVRVLMRSSSYSLHTSHKDIGTMENITKDYVFLDGVWLKQEKLLEMASQAGSMVVAEHYLCAYLTNALLNGNREAIKNLNAIRKVYNQKAIPFTEEDK